MRKKSIYITLCIGLLMLASGCRQVPDDIKEKAKKYQSAEAVEENDIKYVSLSHILDHQKEVLGKGYQNLEFRETVHLEQPNSISVLSMTIANPFGSKEKFADVCSAFYGTDKYRQEITRMENLPEYPNGAGVYAFHYNEDETVDSGHMSDDGFFALHKKGTKIYEFNTASHVYHVDWNENMEDAYDLDGEKVSIREAVDYVNEWCNTNWTILEPEYSYQVKTVYVCPTDHTNYYSFDVCKFYQGMPFDDIFFNMDDVFNYQNMLYVVMEHKGEFSFFRNDGHGYDIVNKEACEDKLIGLEQAVLLVQEKMSGGQKFEITDIDLKYVIYSDMSEEEALEKKLSFYDPGLPVIVRPVWSFIMEYPMTEEDYVDFGLPRKFINVDMITGEILYRDKLEDRE